MPWFAPLPVLFFSPSLNQFPSLFRFRQSAIVKYPSFHPSRQEGTLAPTFTTMMDVLPTLLELAGIQHPAPKFRGKQVLAPRGKSWVPYFSNTSQHVHDENATHGWELVFPFLLFSSFVELVG